MYITVPCCHNNLHNPLNYNFHYSLQLLVILTISFCNTVRIPFELAPLYCSIDINEQNENSNKCQLLNYKTT